MARDRETLDEFAGRVHAHKTLLTMMLANGAKQSDEPAKYLRRLSKMAHSALRAKEAESGQMIGAAATEVDAIISVAHLIAKGL